MDPNQKLMIDQGELFLDPERYRRLVGKLIYLTITFKYVKGNPRQGLLFENKEDTQVFGYKLG